MCVSLTGLSTPRLPALQETLSAEQAVGQLFGIDVYGPSLNSTMKSHLAQIKPGVFSLFRGNIDNQANPVTITRLVRDIKAYGLNYSPREILVLTDQESQTVARLRGDSFTVPPNFTELGNQLDTLLAQHHPLQIDESASPKEIRSALAKQYEFAVSMTNTDKVLAELATAVQAAGNRVGSELAAIGVNGVYAPVLDRAVTAPILRGRAISQSPIVVALVASWYVTGLRQTGIKCVAKHAPGLGQISSAASDPHKAAVTISLSEADLFPYRVLHRQNLLDDIMLTHVRIDEIRVDGVTQEQVKNITKDGWPASVSSDLVSLLQTQLKFTGPFFADGLGMQSLRAFVDDDPARACLLLLLAGVSVFLFDPPSADVDQLASFNAVYNSVAAVWNNSEAINRSPLSAAEQKKLAEKILLADDMKETIEAIAGEERQHLAIMIRSANRRLQSFRNGSTLARW